MHVCALFSDILWPIDLNPKLDCKTIVQVVPVKSELSNAAEQMQVTLAPHSVSAFDLALAQSKLVAEM